MDSVLAEIYSTVFSGAPFVIAAYALLWLVLCVFVVVLLIRFKRVEKEIAVLEDAVENRRAHLAGPAPTEPTRVGSAHSAEEERS